MLRRLRREIEKGDLTPNEGKTAGYEALRRHFQLVIGRELKEYVEKKDLNFRVTGNEGDMRRSFDEAVESWYDIVDDLSGV